MIVVIGSPRGRLEHDRIRASGLSAWVAIAAAARGRPTQLVGRIGDDDVADAVLQDLTRHGVGHVAILRDASHATPTDGAGRQDGAALEVDGADVELALRYLTDFAVLVVIEGGPSVRSVAERAAAWGGADLILVGGDGTSLTPADGETMDAFATRLGGMAADQDEAAAVRSGR